MSDVVIGASIQVDSSQAAPSVKQVRDQIKGLKEELDQTTAGSKEHVAVIGKLKEANQQLNPVVKEHASTLSAVKDHLSASVPAFKGASEGANGLSATLKALLANPVVLVIAAIVAVLKLLYDAFKNSFAGGEKLEQVFSGIKAVAQALMDNIVKLGGAIVKAMTFDFSGAIKDIKEVGNAAASAYSRMAELTKQAQQLARDQADNDLDQANRQKRLAILREEATDETIPIAKRKAALLELKKDAEQNSKDDIALAKKISDNKIAQLELEKDGNKKNYVEIQKIKAEQIRVETDNANELRRIGKQITSADKSEQTERNAAEKEANAKSKEERQKSLAERKAIRENYKAFTEKLTKLEQENELSLIEDGDKKKLKELQFSLTNEKALIDKDFEEKKITGTQRGQLIAEIERANQNKVNAVFAEGEKQRLATLQKAIEARKTLIRAGDLTDDQQKQRATLLRQLTLKETDIKLQDLQSEYNDRLNLVRGNEEAEMNLKKWYSDQKKQIDQGELDFKLSMYDQIGAGIGALGGLFDKSTAAAKIAALAEIGIGTATGFIRALEIAQKSAAGTGPAAAFAFPLFYASQIAAVLGAAGKAKSALSSSSSSGTVSATAPVTPSAPLQPTASQTSTTLDAQSINGIGNAAGNRAFVLDVDVANAQERRTRLNRAARLS